MARNPESIVTDHFKHLVEALGGHYFKLSDRYTRGIPDCHVTFDRGVFVEIKEGDYAGPVKSYQSLTVRGAQDNKIRQMCHRNRENACVVTMPMSYPKKMSLWVPVRPEREGRHDFNMYRLAAVGEAEVMRWLGHKTSQT